MHTNIVSSTVPTAPNAASRGSADSSQHRSLAQQCHPAGHALEFPAPSDTSPQPYLDLSPVGLDDLMPLVGAESDATNNWRALRFCRSCWTRRLSGASR